jgi:hypothetical protein
MPCFSAIGKNLNDNGVRMFLIANAARLVATMMGVLRMIAFIPRISVNHGVEMGGKNEKKNECMVK